MNHDIIICYNCSLQEGKVFEFVIIIKMLETLIELFVKKNILNRISYPLSVFRDCLLLFFVSVSLLFTSILSFEQVFGGAEEVFVLLITLEN